MLRQFLRSKALPIFLAILVVAWAQANGATTLPSFLRLLGEKVKYVVACENGFNIFCDIKSQEGGGAYAPVSPSRVAEAQKTLPTLKVRLSEKVTYSRKEWEYWEGKPCNTREAMKEAGYAKDEVPEGNAGDWRSYN